MRKQLRARLIQPTEGLSLIEIMVAIAVATIAMTALVVVTNTAVRGVDTARGRTTADQYVREGTEQMRAYRDKEGWADLTTGLVANTDKYYSLSASGVPTGNTHTITSDPCTTAVANPGTYQVPGNTSYYRIVKQRLENSGSQDRITVTVCYDVRNGKWQSASAETLLTNWR